MIEEIIFGCWIFGLFITHEYGHYLIAKLEGIYYGWGVLPFPHIKMKKPYDNWYDYLSGLCFSIVTYPVFFISGYPDHIFWFYVIGISLADFIPIVMWKTVSKIKLEVEAEASFKGPKHKGGINQWN